MHTSRFRLIDLAVVGSVVAIGLALLMPALARARTSARAASCSDHFKLIGLAMHNYHDVFRTFPPGRIWADPKTLAKDPRNSAVDWGVGVMLLPFIEQAALYNSVNFKLSWHAVANRTSCNAKLETYLCPEDSQTTKTAMLPPTGQPTNIAFPLGSLAWSTHASANRGPKPEGLFFDNSKIGLPDIIDGTSNTVMASEQLIDQVRCGGPDENGECQKGMIDAKAFSDLTGTRWITGHPSSNYFNGRRSPNHADPDCFEGESPAGIGSLNKVPRSRHDGGVHVLRADGSIAFARNGIDLKVWQSLLTRGGGELVERDALGAIPIRPAPPADPNVLLSVDFQSLQQLMIVGSVDKAANDGKVQLSLRPEAAGRPLAEGLYVGILIPPQGARGFGGMKVVRTTVVEVGERNSVTIQVAPTAVAEFVDRRFVVLVRPPGSSTAQLRLVPDLVAWNGEAGEPPSFVPAVNNLKQIGLAMHNFHDAYGCFPPAVVFGPDGKPWHSWRVLLLPFLDQTVLYNQYDFAEPWDGPNNRKLLDKMPEVYRDPIYGDAKGQYTHFSVITGQGTAFPSQGVTMKENKLPEFRGPGVRQVRDIQDGTSFTLFAGSVSPKRKIPWTKPEDVVFGPNFKKLGEPESFAAPHKGAGVFLFGDGSVNVINDSISVSTLSALLTVDGREVIDSREIPTVSVPKSVGMPRGFQLIRTPEGVTLRLVN